MLSVPYLWLATLTILRTVYGWKGGTLVTTSEGGELMLSVTVMASEGQDVALSVGYSVGEANIPRTFTLDYDEHGKLCCVSQCSAGETEEERERERVMRRDRE